LMAAISTLAGAASAAFSSIPNPIASYQGLEEWYADPTDPTLFRRHVPTYPMLLVSARAILEATPEWSAARDALHADKTLGPLVDHLVGTPLGRGTLQADGLLHSAIERSLSSDDPFRAITERVTEWRESLGADPVVSTTVVVVGGVVTSELVHLSDDVVIRSMTDAEVAAALRVNAIPVMPMLGPIASVHDRTCIAIRQELRRVVGNEEVDLNEAMSLFAIRDAQVAASLAALRLLGFHRVREYSRITTDGRGATQFGLRGSGVMLGPSDPIDRSSEGRARTIFAAVMDAVANRSQMAIALRRYSGSHEPRHDEDRLLDLWIAVEALFSPMDATEVTYRVAQNVANSVDVPSLSRRELFEWVKRAYGLRSDLVHGRGPTLRRVTRLYGGETETVGDAADDLAEVLGIAIRRFLFEAAPPDFTQLALRNAEAPTGDTGSRG
jgi:Apea-like HEPN